MEIVEKNPVTKIQVHDIEEGHAFRYGDTVFIRVAGCTTLILTDGTTFNHVYGVGLGTGGYFTCPPESACLVEPVIAKVTVE